MTHPHKFEVFIPSTADHGFDTVLKVTSSSWLGALRVALAQAGEVLQRGLLCRMQPDRSLRVTDPHSRRVFRIIPLPEPGIDFDALTPPPRPAPSLHDADHAPLHDTDTFDTFDTFDMSPAERRRLLAKMRSSGELPVVKLDDPSYTPTPSGTILSARQTPSGLFSAIPPSPEQHLLSRVLDRGQWLYERDRTLEQAADAMLSLAVELIPSESGAALFPDLQGRMLHFVSAYGPHADRVRGLVMPINQGLASFCMHEGISLAVDDARQDPRFNAAISQHLHYQPHSVLCSPLLFDGRVYGVLELLNSLDHPTFTFSDLSLLSHIGSHLAQYINLQI
jgi:hypothetical protein